MEVEEMTDELDAIMLEDPFWSGDSEDKTQSVFKNVELSDLESAQLPETQHALKPHLPKGDTGLLSGHGGSGKSLLALIGGAHVACGRDWAGLPVQQGKVLYASLEDPGVVLRLRLRKTIEAYGLDYAEVQRNLTILDGSDVDAYLATEVSEMGVRRLRLTESFHALVAAASGYSLIIIDNASDAFGGNENDRQQVRFFVRSLTREIARPNNAAVLLLAHVDKAGARYGTQGNSYSGSTAWHNSVRSRFALLQSEDGELELHHEKNNLGPKHDPIPLMWTDDGVLLPQIRDRVKESLAAEQQAKTDATKVLDVLAIAKASGEFVTAATSGAHTTLHSLQRFPELGSSFNGKLGKKRFNAALLHLLREKKIQKIEYRDGNRNAKTRLEPTQSDEKAGL